MTKLLKCLALSAIAILIQSPTFAQENSLDSGVKLSEIMQKWSDSMHKKIKVELTDDPKFILSKESIPTNIDEFSTAFGDLNNILDKGNKARIHACVFDTIIVIVPTTVESDSNSCQQAGLVKQN
jgi:hypothetical protein